MPHGVDKVEYDSAPPERSDVVVIGGGMAGVSSAPALAEKGFCQDLRQLDIAANSDVHLTLKSRSIHNRDILPPRCQRSFTFPKINQIPKGKQ